jgi:nuclear transport factor 2 (NTF2) superfamily protein
MARPPLPRSQPRLPRRRRASRKMPGTLAIPRASPSPIPSTASGAIAPSSFAAAKRSRAFLTRKWSRELDYRLIKEVWTFRDNRIAVRFAYEWHDDSGNWFRSYGNENWEFDADGLMRRRIASINDLPIRDGERKYHWPLGRRPDDHPSLSDLAL